MARKFAFIRLKITRDAIVSQFQGQNPSRYLISSAVEVSYEHQHNYDIPNNKWEIFKNSVKRLRDMMIYTVPTLFKFQSLKHIFFC